jgi:hypothetical protein
LRVIIAGRGLFPKEWSELIMQFDKLRARRETRVARLSGISVKRLQEMSKCWSVLATDARLIAEMVVRPLSSKLNSRRKRHFDIGTNPNESKLDELPRGVLARSIDSELAEDLR